MPTDCIFCKIVAGDIPSAKVYEDEFVYAFKDIAPQAPVHVLLIPKTHIPSAAEVTTENAPLVAACFAAIPQIAREAGLDSGFRLISNTGEDGCQTVFHLHFHLLGGKQLEANLV